MKPISISIEDIREAEKVLLDAGGSFDDENSERIQFIQNLKTCDLLAVPGSGKTTALLAKLYCLHKYLPFEDGSGILVLAHTNAAIDEIKEKLQPHCPRLFQYPNFIDTVQSFVNNFLTKPYANDNLGIEIDKYDNDLYEKTLYKEYSKLKWNKEFKLNTLFYSRHISRAITESIDFKNCNKNKSQIEKLIDGRKLDDILSDINNQSKDGGKLITNEMANSAIDKFTSSDLRNIVLNYKKESILLFGDQKSLRNRYLQDKSESPSYLGLKRIIETALKKGIISYNFSYILGENYLDFFPKLGHLINQRFKHVFIDEMQDLQLHQIDIIDKIFFNKDSTTVIQRIGDKNQAIYSSSKKVKVESVWKTREEQDKKKYKDLIISGSNRLTKEVAQIVDSLVLDRKPDTYKVIGNRVLEKPLQPRLIVFNKETRKELPELFKKIISEYQKEGKLPIKDKKGNAPKFKLIAWNGEWGDERTESSKDKIRLEDIVDYSKEAEGKKEFLDSLSKHLQLYDKDKRTMEAVRKSILNALIHILKLEEITYPIVFKGKTINRYYRKSKLIEVIKERSKEDYDFFKAELYNWCWQTITGNEKNAYDKIKAFVLTTFKEWFALKVNAETEMFLESEFKPIQTQFVKKISVKNDEIEISIGTVHSVKGQTHCATMYVETAYQTPTYESNKLIKKVKDNITSPLFIDNFEPDGIYAKQAKKMMYVGFSRPTHLLCFAALEENVKEHIEKFEAAGWRIDKTLI